MSKKRKPTQMKAFKKVMFKQPLVDVYVESDENDESDEYVESADYQLQGSSFTNLNPLNREFVNINDELDDLANQSNLLIIMVYILLVATTLHSNLQNHTLSGKVNVQCDIEELSTTAWTFEQKRNITSPLNKNYVHGCFYYRCKNYSYLATLSYEKALLKVQECYLDVEILKCRKYLYQPNLPNVISVIQEFQMVCDEDYEVMYNAKVQLCIAVSSFVIGVLSDIYGRRHLYIFSALIATLGCVFIPVAATGDVFRFGYILKYSGLRGALSNVVIIFTEICSSDVRTLLLMIAYGFHSVGIIISRLLPPLITKWRILELAIQCPIIIILFGIIFLPESPRWLMVKEQYLQAWKVLQEMGSRRELITESNKSFRPSVCEQLHVFHTSYFMYRLCIVIIIDGVSVFTTNILNSLGLEIIANQKQLDMKISFTHIIVICFMGVLSYHFNKKTLCFGLFLFLAMCFIAGPSTDSQTIKEVSLLGAELFSVTLDPLIAIYALEIFPTSHRGTAYGCINAVAGILKSIYFSNRYMTIPPEQVNRVSAVFCTLAIICALITGSAPTSSKKLPDIKRDIENT